MKKTTLLLILSAFQLFSLSAFSQSIYVPFRWVVNTARPAKQTISIYRGETVAIEPTFSTYEGYVDLTSCYEARLEYRSSDMDAGLYYYATGSVINATQGEVRIIWSPDLEAEASSYQYRIRLSGNDSASLKAQGTIKMLGVSEFVITNILNTITSRMDWATVEHINIDAAPFADDADLLALHQKDAEHDVAISNITDLVGTGVAGVQSNLDAHVEAADIKNASQDEAIAAAADGANMGGDVTGVSSNSVVEATRGRTFPTEADVPVDLEAIVWDSTLNGGLGGYRHGSVDLSGLENDIALLDETKADQSEVDGIAGMVDGNDHTLMYVETFAQTNWLETSPNVWEHLTNPTWSIVDGEITAGNQLTLHPDYGTCILEFTQCVSRVELSPDIDGYIFVAPTIEGPWVGYDSVKDNIPNTNMFAVKLYNGGAEVTVSDATIYTWAYPERVGYHRDFAGLYLLVDTPDETYDREAVNVKYVQNLAPGGDLTGTLGTGLAIDKIQGSELITEGKVTGDGLTYYESLDQWRPTDLATQAELDAVESAKTDQTDHDTLAARVTATENGNVNIDGEVTGRGSNTVVRALGGKLIPDGSPSGPVSFLFDSATDRWLYKTTLSTNIVYASGVNSAASAPADSVGFLRAASTNGHVMHWIVDQQVVAVVSTNGLTIPHGTLNILNQLLKSNVELYDGSASDPALAFAENLGWHRASVDGHYVWRFMAEGALVLDIGPGGIKLYDGSTITLADGSEVASQARIDLSTGIWELQSTGIAVAETLATPEAGFWELSAGKITTGNIEREDAWWQLVSGKLYTK